MFEYMAINFHGNMHMLANEMNFNYAPQGWELISAQFPDPFVIVVMLKRQVAPGPFQFVSPISTKA